MSSYSEFRSFDGVVVFCDVSPSSAGSLGRALECVEEYMDRKSRISHPKGKRDSAGRFYLNEHYRCCAGIRSPSRAFPFSQSKHGRSLPHVAHEFGMEEHLKVLRQVANVYEKNGKEAAIELLNSPRVKRSFLEKDFGV